MLLVLPPSEGKTAPPAGDPLDLAALGHRDLTVARLQVLTALERASARPDGAALLGVGVRAAAEVARNTRLRTAPTAPASEVCSGVLYAAARLDELRGVQAERAAAVVRTVSALWGAVSPADLIPAYRLAMGTDLPGVGRLAAFWRPHLARALAGRAAGDLVVDCRSAAYAAAWAPPSDAEHVAMRGVIRHAPTVVDALAHAADHQLATGRWLTPADSPDLRWNVHRGFGDPPRLVTALRAVREQHPPQPATARADLDSARAVLATARTRTRETRPDSPATAPAPLRQGGPSL